jgi:hypothetical protein
MGNGNNAETQKEMNLQPKGAEGPSDENCKKGMSLLALKKIKTKNKTKFDISMARIQGFLG